MFRFSENIKESTNFIFLFIISLIIRILCNLVFSQFYIFDDELGYMIDARKISNTSEDFQFVDNQYKNYLALLYYITDGFWLAKFLNIVYSCLSAIFAFNIIKEITHNEKMCWYTYYLFIFFPPS